MATSRSSEPRSNNNSSNNSGSSFHFKNKNKKNKCLEKNRPNQSPVGPTPFSRPWNTTRMAILTRTKEQLQLETRKKQMDTVTKKSLGLFTFNLLVTLFYQAAKGAAETQGSKEQKRDSRATSRVEEGLAAGGLSRAEFWVPSGLVIGEVLGTFLDEPRYI
eukprot:1004054-Prorocentrum_minimum.AAC.1